MDQMEVKDRQYAPNRIKRACKYTQFADYTRLLGQEKNSAIRYREFQCTVV